MQFMPIPGRKWLYETWRHKTSMLGGVLAIISLSLAHYAGFLMDVPLQIVSVAGLQLAKGVTATFLFYIFFCAVCARVITSMVQLIILPGFAISDRLERGLRWKLDWPQQRRFVRSHTQIIKWEGFILIIIKMILFIILISGIYLDFTATWISAAGIFVPIILAIISILLRSGFFLQPKSRIFIRKVRMRSASYGRLTSAVFVTSTAALVIAAFFMGNMRANLLRKQEQTRIITKEFTGMAAVIASSDGALLMFQKKGSAHRYIYSAPEFTTSVESKNVFQPIGSKSGQQ